MNKAIRGILSPVLKQNGFTKINTRNNWGWHDECIWVLNINTVGKGHSEVTSWTPMSLTVSMGIYYNIVPPLDDEIKVTANGKWLPFSYQCHSGRNLHCQQDQSSYKEHFENLYDRERKDVWWVESDGSNLEEVLEDIKRAFLNEGLPWLKNYTDLETAFEEIEQEEDSYYKFYKAKYFANRLNKIEQFEGYDYLAEVLPRQKFDFERVKKLKGMDRKELIPLLPKLLVWIQDINWPIAPKIAELLLAFPSEIVLPIKSVFATNDHVWKYWCLAYLVKQLPLEEREHLKADLIRLAEQPSDDEKLEEVDEMASEILQTMQ
jgi:hypothetical protein